MYFVFDIMAMSRHAKACSTMWVSMVHHGCVVTSVFCVCVCVWGPCIMKFLTAARTADRLDAVTVSGWALLAGSVSRKAGRLMYSYSPTACM
jgi:hypothetical protein